VHASDTDTSTPGFNVDYVSHGKKGTTYVRYELHSCVDGSTDRCAHLCEGAKGDPRLPTCDGS
jgi:hypothetical protein